jgi:hypothetical protein
MLAGLIITTPCIGESVAQANPHGKASEGHLLYSAFPNFWIDERFRLEELKIKHESGLMRWILTADFRKWRTILRNFVPLSKHY